MSKHEGLDFNSVDFVDLSLSENVHDPNELVICGSDQVQVQNGNNTIEAKFRNIRISTIKEGKEMLKANFWSQSSTCSEYTSVKHIWLNNKTRGFLAATDQGSLAILAMDFKEIDNEIEVINTHFGGVVDMMVSPCERTLFTTGVDGTIFIFDIKEQLYNRVTKETRPPQIIEVDPQDTKKGTVKDTRQKIMDQDLADIVFVKKNQMDEWKHS